MTTGADATSAGTSHAPLEGRVAVVTGAGRGLGRAIAVSLAEAGADVVLAARSAEQLRDTAASVEAAGRRALPVPTDITDASDTARLATEVRNRFGHIDVLVNNAGVLREGSVLEMPEVDWDVVLATNVRGPVNCVRAVGPTMIEAGHGKVINVTSTFASGAVKRFAAYSMSKAALNQFTRVLAKEWAPHGIQVNGVAPGYFATDFNADARADAAMRDRIVRSIPARRFGTPAELGPLVVFLASAASDYMTGETITIDGGWQL